MANADLRPKCNYKADRKVGNFITQSNAIVLEMTGSPFFPTPPSPYITVTGHITALQTAETLAKTRTTGAAAARDIRYEAVLKDIRSYQIYVQSLADAAPDRPTAIAIIDASGFGLRDNGVRIKPPLAAKLTAASGTVRLIAVSAGKKATYDWEMSLDNGVTYTSLPSTLKAKTLPSGLPLYVRILFRVRSLSGLGLSPWCTAVGILTQ
jgi:hypothetical protein